MKPARLFEHRFRCPLCFAGQPMVLNTHTLNKQWMTGSALDKHVCSPTAHSKRRASYFAQRRKQKLETMTATTTAAAENEVGNDDKTAAMMNNRNNNNNKKKTLRNPFFSSAQFRSELDSCLFTLPSAALVDRILVTDTTNVQHSHDLGFTSSTSTIEFLWSVAFSKRRIAVVFVHENMLQHSAPIFNMLGALAEGSANKHDGGVQQQQQRTSTNVPLMVASSQQQLPMWRRRGLESRLLAGGPEAVEKLLMQVSSNNNNRNSSSNPATGFAENPFRPWNSVVVPTRRSPEAGDLALIDAVRRLTDLLEQDEARILTKERNTTKTVRPVATHVDVLTQDTELSLAIASLAGGAGVGRARSFSSVLQWAEVVSQS